jgi:FkbM family methyltransferase
MRTFLIALALRSVSIAGCSVEREDSSLEVKMLSPVPIAKHNDLIYDIGMHKGEDAEFYLRKGFRVVAFEADPDLIVSCKERLKEFLERGKLTIVEGAIVPAEPNGTFPKTVRFYKNRDVSVWGTVLADWAERNACIGTPSSIIEVKAVDFSGAIRKYGVPHFMKIDIEGCDAVCIAALDGFEEKPTYLSIESDKTSIENVERELDLLHKLGYLTFQAVEQSKIPRTQHPPYPTREGDYAKQQFEPGSSGLFGLELGGKWKSKGEIMRQYRFILFGYYLTGDGGVMTKWTFPGARLIRFVTRRLVGLLTHAEVPGWYDTHARHACADDSRPNDLALGQRR